MLKEIDHSCSEWTRPAPPELPHCPALTRARGKHIHTFLFRLSLIKVAFYARCTHCAIYRKKRREERAGKTEVTFRPNESIIPLQEVMLVLVRTILFLFSRVKCNSTLVFFQISAANKGVSKPGAWKCRRHHSSTGCRHSNWLVSNY